MKDKLFIPSKECTEDENALIADHLRFNRHHGMEGMVAVLHKRKDGFREILPPTNNHIVMSGRRWIMEACMDQKFSDSVDHHTWTLNWFGVGSGGTLANSPNVPLDTSDNTTALTNILRIRPNTVATENEYLYTVIDEPNGKLGRRKRLKCYGPNGDDQGNNVYRTITEMNYNTSNSEVMMLVQLEVDYEDCPSNDISVAINELGLYASPTPISTDDMTNSKSCILFSRYCRPTIYKTSGDAYLFMWYIYF